MPDLDQRTPAEAAALHAAEVAAAEAALPVPLRHPLTNKTRLFAPRRVAALLAAGWVR